MHMNRRVYHPHGSSHSSVFPTLPQLWGWRATGLLRHPCSVPRGQEVPRAPSFGPLDSLDSDSDDTPCVVVLEPVNSHESLGSVDSFFNVMQTHMPGCGSHTGPLVQWQEVTAQGCYALHGPARISKAGPGILRAELLPGSWLEMGGAEFASTISMNKEVLTPEQGLLHQHVVSPTSHASHDFTTSFSMSEDAGAACSPEPTCLLLGEHMELRGPYALDATRSPTPEPPQAAMSAVGCRATSDAAGDGQTGSSTGGAPCSGILRHDDFVMLSVHALPDSGVVMQLEEGSVLSHPINMYPSHR